MHPVFVEAVKKNQIGVAPQEPSFLVTTAPGTIPVTVRPPRIPELVGAPTMTGEVPSPQLAVAEAAAADKHAAAPAYATTSAAAAKPSSNSGGLFGSLFASKSSDTKTDTSGSAIDRMARLVGLRSDDKDAKPVAAPAPKPKPAAKPTSVASNGAIRSKPAEATPVKTTEAQAPAPAPAPAAAAPAPAAAAPARAAAPASTAMNGAAPVMQTGSFDSRWSGFR